MVRFSISLATRLVPTISTTRNPSTEIPESPRSTVSRRPSPSTSGLRSWVASSSTRPAATTPPSTRSRVASRKVFRAIR